MLFSETVKDLWNEANSRLKRTHVALDFSRSFWYPLLFLRQNNLKKYIGIKKRSHYIHPANRQSDAEAEPKYIARAYLSTRLPIELIGRTCRFTRCSNKNATKSRTSDCKVGGAFATFPVRITQPWLSPVLYSSILPDINTDQT